ncbi:FKBP-type peptidyl-prolyl cis-trans isomerase [Mucilaginibacter sp.]|uniref:FKBP-type peptidyl-prolyl cis-trans isomerase n=1 Tax=Mucilaginibacter sp. TaxID=1882438 RepID=UPI003D0D0224
MMKYILFVLALTIAVSANAQNTLQSTPKGAQYQIFTSNTGEKIKLNDIITFQYIQKTDKDSVLFSTYTAGHSAQTQVRASQNVADLMEIFPLLTVKDSLFVKVPTDSLFKGHEEARPPFFPKGSNLNFTLKIEKVQSLDDYMAEVKSAEANGAAKYIADHKLLVKTTPTGLKYVFTHPTLKRKPLKGDTLLVNYIGRTVDGKVFDTSIESAAKEANLEQPGRTYEPYPVVVGTAAVIPGWDEGLLLMNEGSKAIFVIPSALAYGAQGNQGIAPYSTLVFDIELVKINPIKHAASPAAKGPVKKPLYKKKAVVKKN